MKTIEITKSVTETITVEFPLYTSDGLHFFMFNENECIKIVNNEYAGTVIEFLKPNLYPESWMFNEKITEEEFKKAWAYAQSEITLKYHQLFSKQNAFIEMVSGGNEE